MSCNKCVWESADFTASRAWQAGKFGIKFMVHMQKRRRGLVSWHTPTEREELLRIPVSLEAQPASEPCMKVQRISSVKGRMKRTGSGQFVRQTRRLIRVVPPENLRVIRSLVQAAGTGWLFCVIGNFILWRKNTPLDVHSHERALRTGFYFYL